MWSTRKVEGELHPLWREKKYERVDDRILRIVEDNENRSPII